MLLRPARRTTRARLMLLGAALALLCAGVAVAFRSDPISQLNVFAAYHPDCEGHASFPPPPERLPEFCLRRPKRVKVTLRSLPSRKVVETIVTERDGLGRVYLPPGEYELRPWRWNRNVRVDVRRVTLVADAPTDVIIHFHPPPRDGRG